MKKVLGKILIIFILIVVLFEFVFSSNICNAAGIGESTINAITNLAGGLVSIIYWDKRVFATGLAFVLDMIVANLAEADGVNYGYSGVLSIITPFDIFFNKYKLLDVNFFDIDGISEGSIAYTIRTSVAGWFYSMRLIASAILLVILIYVGIRMAISSVAEEKAKYKKMLFDWCCSLLLIFVLQYIAIFTIYCNNAIVNALSAILTDKSVEDNIGHIITGIGLNAVLGVGITSIASVLVFCGIIFQSIAFLIAYISRMIKVGFLIIISPLISLTYSIDKMGDGKAQALGKWLKEFIYTILIQPFHCVLYIAFVRTAFALIVETTALPHFGGELGTLEYNQLANGVLAILCIKFISDGEKIVRKIFGFEDDNSSTSFAGGIAVGMMAVKNAQKIGNSVGKGVNIIKTKSKKVGKAIAHDGKMLKNNNWAGSSNPLKNALGQAGKFAGKFEQGIEKKGKAFGNLAKNSKAGRVIGKVSSKVNGFKGKFKGSKLGKAMANRKFGSLSSTLGIMGASMAYMSGGMGALDSFTLGKSISSGTGALFSSSDNTSSKELANLNEKEDKEEYKKLNKDIDKLDKEIKDDKDALEDTSSQEKYEELISGAEAKEAEAKAKEEQMKKFEEEAKHAKTNKTYYAKLKHAEDAKKEAEMARKEAKEKRGQAQEIDDKSGGRHSEIRKIGKEQFEKNIKDQKEVRLTALKKKKEEFWDKKNVERRMRNRSRGASTAELQGMKNEIIQKLYKLKLEASRDNSEGNEITLDDHDSIERTADWMIDNISLGVLNGQGFNIEDESNRKYIEKTLKLKDDLNTDNSTYQDLIGAASDFESLQVDTRIADICKNYSNLEGDPDDITEKASKIISNRHSH